MKKKYVALFLILLLASFLRLWQIGGVPPAVHTDEADMGYEAYSVILTGHDPHGGSNLFALSDDNTGGTHPPVYVVALLPLVKFFGLNIVVERLPSAVFGIFSVLLVFFIAKKLINSSSVALVAALLFALNPWAIHISRAGLLEAGSLFFVLAGTALFLYSDKNKFFLIFSAVFFGLSFYVYQAPLIFLPLFVPLLSYFYWEKLKKFKKYLVFPTAIFLIFFASVIYFTFFQGGIDRYSSRSSIFGAIPENVNTERTLTTAPIALSSIFHNKLSVPLKRLETSFSDIFSINWFFINGSGNLQHAVGSHGEFFLFELPFFFIGIYLAFKKRLKLGLFLLGWMLLGALPGGLTSGNYGLRSVHVLPVPIYFSSLGIVWFWEILSKKSANIKYAIRILLILIMFVYVSSYLVTYFFDYPVYASESWSKQQDDAIKYIGGNKNKYQAIFADGGEPWAITYAYFNKIDPAYYQKEYENQIYYKGIKVIKIDNIYFGNFGLDKVPSPSEFFPKGSMIVTSGAYFYSQPYLRSFKDPGGVRDIFKVFIVK